MPHRWRTIPGFKAYEVSDRGVVRRRLPGRGTYVGRILKPSENDGGYLMVCLYGRYRVSVHRLVCWTFNGPPPSREHEATHRNGRQKQNRPRNLAWRTHHENILDKHRHGTMVRGTRHPAAKLNPRKVRRIRELVPVIGLTATGRRYGVTKQAVAHIIAGRTWGHVK